MPRILGIETSGELCSVALLVDGDAFEDTRKMQRMHNEHVLELVDTVMRRADAVPGSLDGVAFGCGPGSFTGVRIAASVAQGIAFGSDACVLPIASTLALAEAARAEAPGFDADEVQGLISIIRSRRDAYYLAGFQCVDSGLRPHREARLLDRAPAWPELDDPQWRVVGPMPSWLADRVSSRRWLADTATDGTTVAKLGIAAFGREEGRSPEFGLPTYIEGDSPWRPSK